MSKRIIRQAEKGMHLGQGMVLYDGMEDFITTNTYDHTQAGTLYAAIDTPVYGEDTKGARIKISDVTELVPVDPTVIKRHKFAGKFPAVGKDIVEVEK